MFQKTLLVFCCCISLSHAMEPTVAKGSWRIQFNYKSVDANSWFDRDQIAQDLIGTEGPEEYTQDSYTTTFTYGWTNDMAVIYRASGADRSLGQDSTNGLESNYLALRQRIGRGGDTRVYAETGVSQGQEDEAPLPLSSGEIDWYLLFSYNQDFYPSTAGFGMDVGYIFRGGDVGNDITIDTSLRLDLLKIVDLTLHYHVLESRDDEKEEFTPLVWPNERGYQDIGLKFSRMFGKKFEAGLSYEKRLEGRNQFEVEGWELSFSWWR